MKTYSRWFTTKEKFFSTLWQKAGYKVIWTDENYDRTEDLNTHYKPNRKGGHTHNHKQNVADKKYYRSEYCLIPRRFYFIDRKGKRRILKGR